jgi:hypothetical protein
LVTTIDCTLLVLDLLLPHELGTEPYRNLRLAALEVLLARGNASSLPPLACEDWLCRSFGVPKQQDSPVAALMLNADGGDAQHYYWLCADPVEVRADRNRLVIAARPRDIEAAEALEFTTALNRHFADDGIVFVAPSPLRWYLRVEKTPQLVTTPLARALNRSVAPHLPQGADALAWHRVINEAQMILHAHPANAAREERGAPLANSVWLWGGGTLAALSRPPYATVWSDEHLPLALAAAAGVAHHELPRDGAAWVAAATGGDHLVVLDAAAQALRGGNLAAWREELVALDRDWIEPLLAALRAKTISTLTLVACNSDTLLEATLAPSGLRRFWRRARPLAGYASDGT